MELVARVWESILRARGGSSKALKDSVTELKYSPRTRR